MERISATKASRSFSEILNRARYGGESFIIERNGEAVAELRPPRRQSTVADLLTLLDAGPPDSDFERDMRDVIGQRRTMYPRDPWLRSE